MSLYSIIMCKAGTTFAQLPLILVLCKFIHSDSAMVTLVAPRNSCHLHSSVVLLVHYLYSFDKKINIFPAN